jgi:dTDP-4-dehydrorhamnose reductase
MKVAVTGSSGLLGSALAEVFSKRHEVLRISRAQADISRAEQVQAALAGFRPEIVIHSAAVRDPDRCELEPELATAVNVEGTRNLVRAAGAVGAAVAYISTDAVFDGKKTVPYTEDDAPAPLSFYGRTKLLGEQAVQPLERHWIFRMPVLFGPGPNSSLGAGLRALREEREFTTASDQVGCAAHTEDAARKILELIEARAYGLFHLANQGAVSRLELAQRAAELAGLDAARITGKTMEQMQRPGPRPKYLVMEMAALKKRGFALPRSWEDALAEYVASLRWLET